MGLRTITLKLYKPGKGKQEILDRALLNYNKAFEFLLERAYHEIAEISDKYKGNLGNYNARVLSKWVGKDISRELNKFDVQPFKDSLKFELGMALASYLELRGVMENVGFPDWKKLRPIYFCRYDIKRSYSLLYDAGNNRYYVKLYLMNGRNSRTLNNQDRTQSKLRYIYRESRLFEGGARKATFIILPLSFGKYQEEFLVEALKNPDSLRTAKLLKKDNEYYLAVSIETGKPEEIRTNTFLGVARGLKNQLNYTIIDRDGQFLDTGPITYQMTGRKKQILLNELHRLANTITALAKDNGSQVILQNLSTKGDRISWMGMDKTIYQPSFSCSEYIRLVKLLEYKLPEIGLPSPVQVSSAGIFHTCNLCGCNSKHNRLNKDVFLCTHCGGTMEIEKLGSLNLAGKLISYSNSKIKIKVLEAPEGIWFKNKLIGLDLFVPPGEDRIEKLKDEISVILADMRSTIKDSKNREKVKKASIIRKFEGSKDLMDVIKLV